jgi:hypothetical protein
MLEWVRRAGARLRGGYHGVTPVLAGLVLAYTLTGMAWPRLQRRQAYSEPVLWCISSFDLDKERDFRALYLFAGLAVGTTVLISVTFRSLSDEGHTGPVGTALNALLGLSLLPACWRLGEALIRTDGARFVPKEAVVGVAAVWLLALALARHRRRLSGPLVLHAGGAALLALALAFFGGLGVALAVGRLRPGVCLALAGKAHLFAYPPVAAVGLAVAVLAAVHRRPEGLRRGLFRLLFAVQAPLPLLFCVLIPPPLLEDGRAAAEPYRRALPLTLGAVAVLRAAEDAEPRVQQALSPLAVAGVALVLLIPTLEYPRADYWSPFYYGEEVVHWQQWYHFGKAPFADLGPVHGFMSVWRGLLNEVFFDGTAAHLPAAELLLMGLSVVTTFLAVSALESPLLALLVSFSCPVVSRMYFLAPALLVLVHPRLRARPALWLVVWAGLSLFLMFYQAAMGFGFALGTAPAAAWMTYRLARTDPRRLAGLGLGTAAAVLAFTAGPAGRMFLGLVGFVRENAATHLVANTFPYEMSLGVPPCDRRAFAGTPFLWDLIRFAWLPAAAFAAVCFWREWARPPAERHGRTLWLAGLLVPVLACCAPYLNGATEPNAMGRTGMASQIVVVYFLPLLLLARVDVAGAVRVCAGLAVVITLFNALNLHDDHPLRTCREGEVGCTTHKALLDKPFAVRPPPPGTVIVDGKAVGLPLLGRAAVAPGFLGELLAFREALAGLLRPGETYFDLSNRSAYYFYLNLPVPGYYVGPCAVGGRDPQAHMLRALDRDPPPVVVAGPADPSTGFHGARSYYLFREFALRYLPVRRGPFIFLVHPARVAPADMPSPAERLALLNAAFPVLQTGKTAAAWGASWDTLASRFHPRGQVKPEDLFLVEGAVAEGDGWYRTQADPSTGVPYPSSLHYRLKPIRGRDADFLKLEVDLERVPNGPVSGPDPVVNIFWASAERPPCMYVQATASRAVLLIPMGFAPDWLLADQLSEVIVQLCNLSTCTRFRVRDIQLLQLDPIR